MSFFIVALLLRLVPVTPVQSDSLSSFQAFQRAAAVLRHPRCMNCHVPGDSPLLGASAEPHTMRVKRGPDGGGTAVMQCTTCHQKTNTEVLHKPPNSKEWRLPSPRAKMAWLGLNDRELCRAIIDIKTNGGMSRANLVHHVETDSL